MSLKKENRSSGEKYTVIQPFSQNVYHFLIDSLLMEIFFIIVAHVISLGNQKRWFSLIFFSVGKGRALGAVGKISTF